MREDLGKNYGKHTGKRETGPKSIVVLHVTNPVLFDSIAKIERRKASAHPQVPCKTLRVFTPVRQDPFERDLGGKRRYLRNRS